MTTSNSSWWEVNPFFVKREAIGIRYDISQIKQGTLFSSFVKEQIKQSSLGDAYEVLGIKFAFSKEPGADPLPHAVVLAADPGTGKHTETPLATLIAGLNPTKVILSTAKPVEAGTVHEEFEYWERMAEEPEFDFALFTLEALDMMVQYSKTITLSGAVVQYGSFQDQTAISEPITYPKEKLFFTFKLEGDFEDMPDNNRARFSMPKVVMGHPCPPYWIGDPN